MKQIIKWGKELFPYIIILVAVLLIRTYLVTPVKVNGTSMQDTLKGNEIMILYKQGKIERFSIVVAYTNNDKLIKRVIALPGETISCENGKIYVNGHLQEEAYSKGNTSDFEEIKLDQDEYFLMGDNREISLDSRILGPIKKDAIQGTTNFILFPFTKFGIVEK